MKNGIVFPCSFSKLTGNKDEFDLVLMKTNQHFVNISEKDVYN